jgi:predicted transcriptional regulator
MIAKGKNVDEIALEMNWKKKSLQRTVCELVKHDLVVRDSKQLIAKSVWDQSQIKAHNPFNL